MKNVLNGWRARKANEMTDTIRQQIKDMVFKFKRPAIDIITKERLQAIIDDDRENEDFLTRRETQCQSCFCRIFYKSELSQVEICSLGKDMDSLKCCLEWRREHRIHEKQTITKADYLEACKK